MTLAKLRQQIQGARDAQAARYACLFALVELIEAETGCIADCVSEAYPSVSIRFDVPNSNKWIAGVPLISFRDGIRVPDGKIRVWFSDTEIGASMTFEEFVRMVRKVKA